MAVTRNLFRIIAQQGHTPEEIATHINMFLSKDNSRGMFVTMFIGMADLKTGHLDYCNCGHNPPVLDGEFMHLEYANLPLGLWEDYTFTGESLDDFRDKQLLVYTDGLNEAEDRDHKELGNDAVLNIMKENAANTSREVIDSLIASVEAHRNGADPNDDLTLLCLKLLVNND
jgi:sigma-B regulation protein RsbU (phosphoserine phosphatase)